MPTMCTSNSIKNRHSLYRGEDVTCNVAFVWFNVSNEIPVVFHNESNYDCHFIMKELANEFKGKFECLGENINTKKTFSVPIEKK